MKDNLVKPGGESQSSGENPTEKSSNRELAERLCKCAPSDWIARMRSDDNDEWLAISGPLRFWSYNEDDLHTHNGDFIAFLEAFLLGRGWLLMVTSSISETTNLPTVDVMGCHASQKTIRITNQPSKARALTAITCQILEQNKD